MTNNLYDVCTKERELQKKNPKYKNVIEEITLDGVQLFAGHMKTYGPVEDINDDSWVR